MVKVADYVFLLILNVVGMILELVASRLMTPYFGNSNFVWTAIIGIILLAGSIGNIIGGKIASKKNPHFIIGVMLLFASVYISMTPMVYEPILELIKKCGMDVRLASTIGSITFFLIPSIILGTVTPVVMKEYIADKNDKGKESGRISAIIALGSLIGTFFGGFYLIPTFGTDIIFSIISMTILVSVFLYRPVKQSSKTTKLSFYIIFFAALCMSIFSIITSIPTKEEFPLSIDTEYGRIIIEESEVANEKVRYYKQSGSFESATFLNEKKKYDLVFEYLKRYNEIFNFKEIEDVVMIGGAAYQYPKYFVSHFPDKHIDVVEIDPVSTELAKKYFFLDDLIKDFGEDRIGLYNDDGRVFLTNSTKKYDAILNDAFSGKIPVETLATVEAASIIKSRLQEGGVYLSNVFGSVSGDDGKFLRSEVKTLKRVFENVYVIPIHLSFKNTYENMMIVATDNDSYRPKDSVELELTDNDIVLTDNYSPVDSMIPVNK